MNDSTRKNCFIEILPEMKTSLKEAQHKLFGQELDEWKRVMRREIVITVWESWSLGLKKKTIELKFECKLNLLAWSFKLVAGDKAKTLRRFVKRRLVKRLLVKRQLVKSIKEASIGQVVNKNCQLVK